MARRYILFARWPLSTGQGIQKSNHDWEKWSDPLDEEDAIDVYKKRITRGADRYFEFALGYFKRKKCVNVVKIHQVLSTPDGGSYV